MSETTDPKDIIIHVGDTPVLEFECVDKETGAADDISTAETKDVYLKPPDDGTVVKLADVDFLTTGKDGVLKYKCLTTILSTHGFWETEAHVVLANGDVITYSGGGFPVEATQRGT